MSLPADQIPVDAVRAWIGSATTRLLGDTLGMSESAWRAPSRLPGWTRAHVAAHVARDAERIAAMLADPALTEFEDPDSDARIRALECGADRSGVDLQLHLDSSASELDRVGRSVTDWARPVRVHGRPCSLATLTLLRLREVCVHHIDLGVGTSADDIDAEAAGWLLRFALGCGEREHREAMTITSASGLTATLGSGRVRRKVSGTDARLWAWLCGRLGADGVDGARGLSFAPL